MTKRHTQKATDTDEKLYELEPELVDAKSIIFDLKTKLFRKETELTKRNPNLSFLASLIDDPETLEKVLKDKITLSEALNENAWYQESVAKDEALIEVVNAFSRTIDTVLRSGYTRNPNIGLESKKKADVFAEDMGKHLIKVRGEGFTSTRAIAKRFNELGIKSARGHDWSHTTVNQLIHRRENLGLENDSPENLTAE